MIRPGPGSEMVISRVSIVDGAQDSTREYKADIGVEG